jgi:HPt (histidine-containing phosphotransfer) domain-containing protein
MNANDKTASLLSALWLRNRPVVDARLDALDRAAACAAAGSLTEEVREDAADTAHKLAGSLGMYGFPQGTRLARELELLLDYPTPDPARISSLALQLRQALFPNP